MNIDVFNGDADGIFSLIQLRKTYPVPAGQQQLVTGVKRDISLLRNISDIQANDASITVLDVSFDKNAADVERVLQHVESLFYCDHHQAKTLFEHPKLSHRIDTSPTVCTALLINTYLGGDQSLWAVSGAYGDGMDASAGQLADSLGLTAEHKLQLKELGVLVNYNGYGACEADLHFPPASLYQQLMAYDDPFAVIADSESPFSVLKAGYEADLALASASPYLVNNDTVLAVQLDNAPWAARISGTYGNMLAAGNPAKAVVIASTNSDGSLTISLRAPKNNPYGAADICSQFPTGGGREGAAGVNGLRPDGLMKFITQVTTYYDGNTGLISSD
ncbi:DHH family phosphoesterase [Alkalimonas collagenimarina]|uniref:DHH family phosphoesterase n=1 Tax=Alkalimonas collagenimarina TaxID=400390 RepID=A0ABT9GZ85_9GAMM|nr:DHH family phosphoesterase [Alkalimonas collagenimarina]MDP4536371.1 DHH family phosphoesterase [Alkalimonas collagenimarina]